MSTSTKATLRRLVVTVTVGSFSIAALMGVVALLSSGDFGEREWQVLGTTLVSGCASMLALCYLTAHDTSYVPTAVAGGMADVVAAASALVLIWGESGGGTPETMLKVLGVATVLALTLAQVSLLGALAGRRAAEGPLLWATLVLAAVLAGTVIALILGMHGSTTVGRLVGIVAILDVLGTVVIIATGVVGREPTSTLTLTLTPELAGRLRHEAELTGRPAGDLAGEAVERYLAAPRG